MSETLRKRAMPAGADRHRSRWLTAFLWVLIAINLGVAIWNWLTTIPPYDPRFVPVWGIVLFGCVNVCIALCLLALLRWQKWGWYGLVASTLVAFGMNLVVFDGTLGRSLVGLLLPAILLGAMKAGRRPVWDRLDEFSASDWVTPRRFGAGALVFLAPVVALLGVVPAVVACDAGQEDTVLVSRGPVYPDGDEIVVSALDGSTECALTHAHTVTTKPISWSPSGDKLLFSSEGHTNRGSLLELYTMNPDGSGITQISQGVPRGAAIYAGEWSPDGEQVLYASRQDGNVDLYVVDRDGSGRTEIVSDRAASSGFGWSPDGSMIAFSGQNESDEWAVYVANADGSDIRRLTSDPAVEHFAAWLSSGALLVRGAPNEDNVDEVFIIAADGSGIDQLTFDGHTRFSAVSPDETTMLVSQPDGDNRDLYLIGLTDDTRVQVTDTEVDIFGGVFSPDGSQVAYSYPTAPNESVVYVVNADGTNPVQVTSDDKDSAVGPWG